MLSPLEILSYTRIAIQIYFIFLRAHYLNLEKHFFQPKHFKVDFSRTTASRLFLAKEKVIHFLMLETL